MKPHCNGYCCSRPAALTVENDMRSWRSLDRSQQIGLGVLAAIILAIIALALYGYYTGAWKNPPT